MISENKLKLLNYNYTIMQIFICCTLIVFIYKDHLLNLNTHILFNFIDPVLNMYFLEWSSKYILGDLPSYVNSIFSLPIAYPFERSLAFSDNLFGNLIIFLPLYIITDNNILSFNLWILLTYIFNFFAMVFFLSNTKLFNYKSNYHKFILSTMGASIFAFSLPAVTLLGGHFQLLAMFLIPIVVFFYEKIWFENSTKDHALFAILLSLQFYLGVQLGFLLIVLLLALTPVYYINRVQNIKYIFLKIPYSFFIVAILLGSLMYPYLISAKLTGYRDFVHDILPNMPSFQDFFTTEISYNFNSWMELNTRKHHEKAVFLGFSVFFLLFILIIKKLEVKKNRLTVFFNTSSKNFNYLFYGFVFLSLLIISESKIFQIFFNLVPGFNSIRTPGRFILAIGFIIAFLIALRLKDSKIFKLNSILIVFYIVFLAELYSVSIPSNNYQVNLLSKDQIKTYKTNIIGPSVVLPLYPMPVWDFMPSLISKMINFSFISPMINIYSGNFPKFNDEISKQYSNINTQEDLNDFINRIARLGFHNIIVDKKQQLNVNKNVEKLLVENQMMIKRFDDDRLTVWSLKNKLQTYYPSLNKSFKEKKGFFEPTNMVYSNSKNILKGRIINDSINGVVQKKEEIPYPFLLSLDGIKFEKLTCNLVLDTIVDSYSEFDCELGSNIEQVNQLYFKNIEGNKVLKIGNKTPNTKPLSEFKVKIEYISTVVKENTQADVNIKVTNVGKEKWNAGYKGINGLAISYSIENKEKNVKTGFDSRLYLPYDLSSGESVTLTIPINNLNEGLNKITFSMVQELVAWFHEKDSNLTSTMINTKEK